jgi:hypothetical protein
MHSPTAAVIPTPLSPQLPATLPTIAAISFQDGIINVHVAIVLLEVIIVIKAMLTAAQSTADGGPDGNNGSAAIAIE